MKEKLPIILVFILIVFYSINLFSAASYGSGNYESGPYGTGATTPVTTPSAGGGGGGCTYDWDCTNWFPAECPVSKVQERICANRGTCSGITGMPNQTQFCVYEHKEPLFDIFLTLDEKSQEACPEQKIKASVKLENYGRVELLDAFMTYWIVDENNKLIFELKDTRNVADRINFDVLLKIPKATPEGTYKLYAQITYSENKTAVAGESFKILGENSCKIPIGLSGYVLFLIIGIGFLIIFILIIVLFKKINKIRNRNPRTKKTKPEYKEKKVHEIKRQQGKIIQKRIKKEKKLMTPKIKHGWSIERRKKIAEEKQRERMIKDKRKESL